jgi:uncharacterized protein with PIN domain
MMYCRRCNNTRWAEAEFRGAADRIALLILRRPYECAKCKRVRLGSIFLGFTSSRSQKQKLETARDATNVKCPECGGTVHRCRRRTVERLLVYTRAYRCFKCEARFWRFTAV